MIALTRQDILLHQTFVPWPVQYQVEQDLLLCRAMIALFSDPFLGSQIAMRGGTILHKAFLAPAARYSEDIDLVVTGNRPEEHIRAAVKRVLVDILGKPKGWSWEDLKLAVRNAARPSRVLRLTYEVPSIIDPGRTLTVIVEANVTERTPHLPVVKLPFSTRFREDLLSAHVHSFDIHEMLGTKMRALFQRKRGRDLFDLYWAITSPAASPVKPQRIIESFQYYMEREGEPVPRSEFLHELDVRLADRGFCSDMQPLLRTDLIYDPQLAGKHVREELLMLLPE